MKKTIPELASFLDVQSQTNKKNPFKGETMKSLLNGLLCASLLVFVTGCGKDNKTGGAGGSVGTQFGNAYNSTNPYYQDPSAMTKQAFDNATAWLNTNVETSTYLGPRTENRDKIVYNAPSCNTKTYLGFIDIEMCKSGQVSREFLASRTVNVVLSNDKRANQKLAQAFAPAEGATLISATQSVSPMGNGGSLYKLTYVKTNGHILQYMIDTGLNSAFNPVEIYDSELAQAEVVSNPFSLK